MLFELKKLSKKFIIKDNYRLPISRRNHEGIPKILRQTKKVIN